MTRPASSTAPPLRDAAFREALAKLRLHRNSLPKPQLVPLGPRPLEASPSCSSPRAPSSCAGAGFSSSLPSPANETCPEEAPGARASGCTSALAREAAHARRARRHRRGKRRTRTGPLSWVRSGLSAAPGRSEIAGPMCKWELETARAGGTVSKRTRWFTNSEFMANALSGVCSIAPTERLGASESLLC